MKTGAEMSLACDGNCDRSRIVIPGKFGMSEPAIAKEQIDLDAQKVIRHLVRNGYQAYLVGGCVRDLLLGRTPKDFDVATSATPSEVRDLFRNCRDHWSSLPARPCRLRPQDHRDRHLPREPARRRSRGRRRTGGGVYIHRDNVFGTAEEDARRRDFTMNGLFYDVEPEKVIDYVGGLHDITQRSVRTIGDPNIRFREDPVRLLRAVKFAARLGFDIEDETYRAMITHRADLQKSAVPRVLEEIYRLLRGRRGGRVDGAAARDGTFGRASARDRGPAAGASPRRWSRICSWSMQGVAAGELPSSGMLLVLLFVAELQPLLDEDARAKVRDPAALVDEVDGAAVRAAAGGAPRCRAGQATDDRAAAVTADSQEGRPAAGEVCCSARASSRRLRCTRCCTGWRGSPKGWRQSRSKRSYGLAAAANEPSWYTPRRRCRDGVRRAGARL